MPSLDRRTLVTGVGSAAVIAGLGTTAIASYVAAQDATPSAEEDTTAPSTGEATDTTDLTTRLQARLDLLTTDLEAVRADIDPTAIDPLVTEATAAIGTLTSAEEPRRTAAATATLIHSAGLLFDAQLEYAGLPSQEAPSSRVLEAAYTTITDASDLTSASIDTSLYTATAQTLYSNAYDLYGSGAWAQAATTARAAAALATGASILLGTADAFGFGNGNDRGMGSGGFAQELDDRGGMHVQRTDGDESETPADSSTPVTVPAPDFAIG